MGLGENMYHCANLVKRGVRDRGGQDTAAVPAPWMMPEGSIDLPSTVLLLSGRNFAQCSDSRHSYVTGSQGDDLDL